MECDFIPLSAIENKNEYFKIEKLVAGIGRRLRVFQYYILHVTFSYNKSHAD